MRSDKTACTARIARRTARLTHVRRRLDSGGRAAPELCRPRRGVAGSASATAAGAGASAGLSRTAASGPILNAGSMTVSASLRVNGRLARRDGPGGGPGEEPPADAGLAGRRFAGRGFIAA